MDSFNSVQLNCIFKIRKLDYANLVPINHKLQNIKIRDDPYPRLLLLLSELEYL